MTTQIYVNLPVKDVQKSVAFFAALGYSIPSPLVDENVACMLVAENIYVTLLAAATFKTCTPKPISDAKRRTEVLITLSCASRAEVDEQVKKAVAAGGRALAPPLDHGDHGYEHGYEDLDGHMWELLYVAPVDAAAPASAQRTG